MTVVDRSNGAVHEIHIDAAARRNPLGLAVIDGILSGLHRAEETGARSVLLSSEGPTFSAGADFDDLTGTSVDVGYDDVLAQLTTAIRESDLPVIVAVQGPCFGAAVDLVMSADLVVAGRSARFEIPATRLGLLYNPASVARMHERLPRGAVRRLMLGVPLAVEDALALGLVAAIVDDTTVDTVVDHARRIAERVAEGSPDAVSATKRLLASLDSGTFDPDDWQSIRLRLLDSEERFRAIAARRRPSPR